MSAPSGTKLDGALNSGKLAKAMREILSQKAPQGYQINVQGQQSAKTVQEVIIEKVASAAMDGKQWAIEFFLQYIEGKPTQQAGTDRDDQATYDRITETTRQHVNAIASRKLKSAKHEPEPAGGGVAAGDAVADPAPAKKRAGAARKLLGMP